MSWVAVGVAGASLLNGLIGSDQAADAQTDAAAATAAEARRQFDITERNTAPYRNVGSQALAQMGSIYGYDAAQNPVQDQIQANAGFSGSYGGTPLREDDWRQLNTYWDRYRGSNVFGQGATGDYSWMNDPDQLGLSPEAAKYVGDNWNQIRGARNFGDINWGAPGIIGTPGYAPQQQQNALSGRPTGSGGWDANPTLAVGPEGAQPQAAPDYSAFYRAPDYDFVRGEGTRNIENRFAARGGAQSGNALRALADFSSGLASQNFYNYMNQQNNLAGLGQTAVNTSANAGANYSSQYGNATMAGGDARASGILGRTAAINNAVVGGYENWLYRGSPRPRNGGWGGGYGGRNGSWG